MSGAPRSARLISRMNPDSLSRRDMNAPAPIEAGTPNAPQPFALGDAVERPAAIWWVLVLGGLTVLAFQGWSTPFYDWWTSHVNWLPGQTIMAWVFIACVPIHLSEALYVYVAAPRSGLLRSRSAWAFQTLLLGYPSTHLFRRRAARLRALRASDAGRAEAA
jgi:Domain of unknown function (DUF4499)